MSDLFGNPVRVDATPPPEDLRLSAAMRRVLSKAAKASFVRRAASFGTDERGAHRKDGVDYAELVDRCVARGWLTFSGAFNTYPITALGRTALALASANEGAWKAGAKDRGNQRRRELRAQDRQRMAA